MRTPPPLSPFPHPDTASPEGIVAVGAHPEPELLKIAYKQGIFPWPHRGLPLLWFSPDPRFVLDPRKPRLSRSLKKAMKRGPYRIVADTSFEAVMDGCAAAPRPGQSGTWITPSMREGYTALFGEGLAHSIEAWDGDELVGGLYGVSFGAIFFGESMFARAPDASKIAFATLLGNLVSWDFDLVDCQTYTDHLARFGAEEWPRTHFLEELARSLKAPTKQGPWRFELGSVEALALLHAREKSEP
jgi:leucyl/phenylalanyl-tRNA---protein transferase